MNCSQLFLCAGSTSQAGHCHESHRQNRLPWSGKSDVDLLAAIRKPQTVFGQYSPSACYSGDTSSCEIFGRPEPIDHEERQRPSARRWVTCKLVFCGHVQLQLLQWFAAGVPMLNRIPAFTVAAVTSQDTCKVQCSTCNALGCMLPVRKSLVLLQVIF